MVCLECLSALLRWRTWARPSFCTKLWYKSMGGFWLGSRCDIWSVFWVFKFIFVTYPLSMLYPAEKILFVLLRALSQQTYMEIFLARLRNAIYKIHVRGCQSCLKNYLTSNFLFCKISLILQSQI